MLNSQTSLTSDRILKHITRLSVYTYYNRCSHELFMMFMISWTGIWCLWYLEQVLHARDGITHNLTDIYFANQSSNLWAYYLTMLFIQLNNQSHRRAD